MAPKIDKKDNGGESTKDQFSIPIINETIEIGKQKLHTATLRISKKINTETRTIDEPLIADHFYIYRVAINRPVDDIEGARENGDEIVIPLFEETAMVARQLILREELHIKRVKSEIHHPRTIDVRKETVLIDKIEPADRGCGSGSERPIENSRGRTMKRQ